MWTFVTGNGVHPAWKQRLNEAQPNSQYIPHQLHAPIQIWSVQAPKKKQDDDSHDAKLELHKPMGDAMMGFHWDCILWHKGKGVLSDNEWWQYELHPNETPRRGLYVFHITGFLCLSKEWS